MSKQNLKNIEMTAKFSNFEVLNEDFTRCRCSIFYTGRNRNYSDITEAALDKFISRKGYANIPVVAHLMKDDDGNFYVGSHDRKIILSNEGIDFIDETIPYGVIPEDCNPSKDLITEKSGMQRKYFSVDVILWSHRYPIMEASYNDEIYFNQSMEIVFDSCETDSDGYVIVHDFHMSALCLLNKRDSSGTDGNNKNQEPCFESSQVKKFSIDESKFKQNFELMLEKLKQYESDGTTTAVQNNVTNEPNKEEKKFMDLEKLKSFLSTFTVGESENATEQYAFIDATENSFTVMDKHDCLKVYTVEFALDDDGNIAADWDGKVEKKFSVVDFETENAVSMNDLIDFNKVIDRCAEEKAFSITEELTATFNEDIEARDTAYAELNDKYTKAVTRLSEYESADTEAKRLAHKNEIDTIVADFAKKIGRSPKFLVYKAKLNADEVTTEQVMHDLTLMAGQEMVSKSASFSYQPQETNVASKKDDELTNRYGHLLDKHRK